MFDGGKGYSDLDFGVRLQQQGPWRLALDRDHYVIHQRHGGPAHVQNNEFTHCNRAMHLLHQELEQANYPIPTRANWTPQSPTYVEVLRGEVCPFYIGEGQCASGGRCDYENLGKKHPLFDEWLASRPKLDLLQWHRLLMRKYKKEPV